MFLTYLEQAPIPQLWPGAVAAMDNLCAHKVKALRAKSEAAGMRRPYLSLSSPDFNPVEPSWSNLKSHLRKVAARTTAALDKAIFEGPRLMSKEDAHGYFAHCGYCWLTQSGSALYRANFLPGYCNTLRPFPAQYGRGTGTIEPGWCLSPLRVG